MVAGACSRATPRACFAGGTRRRGNRSVRNPCEPRQGSPPSRSAPTAARWSAGGDDGQVVRWDLPSGTDPRPDPASRLARPEGRLHRGRPADPRGDSGRSSPRLGPDVIGGLRPSARRCDGDEPGHLPRRRSLRDRHRRRHRPAVGFDHTPPERADVQARRERCGPWRSGRTAGPWPSGWRTGRSRSGRCRGPARSPLRCAPRGPVRAVSFSRDGRHLLAVGGRGLRRWGLGRRGEPTRPVPVGRPRDADEISDGQAGPLRDHGGQPGRAADRHVDRERSRGACPSPGSASSTPRRGQSSGKAPGGPHPQVGRRLQPRFPAAPDLGSPARDRLAPGGRGDWARPGPSSGRSGSPSIRPPSAPTAGPSCWAAATARRGCGTWRATSRSRPAAASAPRVPDHGRRLRPPEPRGS